MTYVMGAYPGHYIAMGTLKLYLRITLGLHFLQIITTMRIMSNRTITTPTAIPPISPALMLPLIGTGAGVDDVEVDGTEVTGAEVDGAEVDGAVVGIDVVVSDGGGVQSGTEGESSMV